MSDQFTPAHRCRKLWHRGLLALATLAFSGLGFMSGPSALEVEDFQIDTVMDLYELCGATSSDHYADEAALLCIGYFSGAIDYHQAVVGPKFPPIVCAPEGTTRQQVIDNFVAWAAAHQTDADLMDSRPIRGAVMSAVDAWPCPAAQ